MGLYFTLHRKVYFFGVCIYLAWSQWRKKYGPLLNFLELVMPIHTEKITTVFWYSRYLLPHARCYLCFLKLCMLVSSQLMHIFYAFLSTYFLGKKKKKRSSNISLSNIMLVVIKYISVLAIPLESWKWPQVVYSHQARTANSINFRVELHTHMKVPLMCTTSCTVRF